MAKVKTLQNDWLAKNNLAKRVLLTRRKRNESKGTLHSSVHELGGASRGIGV